MNFRLRAEARHNASEECAIEPTQQFLTSGPNHGKPDRKSTHKSPCCMGMSDIQASMKALRRAESKPEVRSQNPEIPWQQEPRLAEDRRWRLSLPDDGRAMPIWIPGNSYGSVRSKYRMGCGAVAYWLCWNSGRRSGGGDELDFGDGGEYAQSTSAVPKWLAMVPWSTRIALVKSA